MNYQNVPANIEIIDTAQGFEPINKIREEMEEEIGFVYM